MKSVSRHVTVIKWPLTSGCTHTKLHNYKTVKECNNVPILYRLKKERQEKESGEVVSDTTILGGGGQETCISGVEGSQAVSSRPSGRGNACEFFI
jgi:hypothetical protein